MAPPSLSTLIPRSRPIPLRKSLLYQSHHQLLTTSPLLLFLRPSDFSAHEWRDLRSTLSSLPSSSLKLIMLRPGLLPAILRDPSLPKEGLNLLNSQSHLQGPLAVLTSPSFHPPTLLSLLKVLTTVSQTPSKNAPPPPSNPSTPIEKLERLELLSSLIDNVKAFDKEGTREIAKLPGLEVLRAQIVGLLSAPAGRLVGVIGAKGGEVGRTLEGLREGLKEAEPTVV